MSTSLRSADLLAESRGFVLNDTVNKLTPDGPFNGSFMDHYEFIFLALCPFQLFKDFFLCVNNYLNCVLAALSLLICLKGQAAILL